MKNVRIENVKLGVPTGCIIVCEAAYKERTGEKGFLALVESYGVPQFYRAPYSLYDRLYAGDDEEEFQDDLREKYAFEFDGEYSDFFAAPDPEWHDLCRYLIYIVRAPKGKDVQFIQKTARKWLSEINIPTSDVEKK